MNDNFINNKNLNFQQFIELLLFKKGVQGIDENTLTELKKDLEERLENFMNYKILEQVPENSWNEFEEFLSANPNEEQIRNYLSKYIAEPEIFLTSVLKEFHDIYLGLA
jgi:hypothetical protein